MNRRQQRGNALVESALIMPLLIGSALVIGDLYNINQARANMELSAHSIVSTLAVQSRLDENGLQALVDQAAAPQLLGDYELVISRVVLDRSMPWKPLHRGTVDGLCEQLSSDTRYDGQLPEELSEDAPQNAAPTDSLLVVQLCRNSDALLLNSGLLPSKLIQTIAFSRMSYSDIELDSALAEEAGLDEQD